MNSTWRFPSSSSCCSSAIRSPTTRRFASTSIPQTIAFRQTLRSNRTAFPIRHRKSSMTYCSKYLPTTQALRIPSEKWPRIPFFPTTKSRKKRSTISSSMSNPSSSSNTKSPNPRHHPVRSRRAASSTRSAIAHPTASRTSTNSTPTKSSSKLRLPTERRRRTDPTPMNSRSQSDL